jgi:hypothetical protein
LGLSRIQNIGKTQRPWNEIMKRSQNVRGNGSAMALGGKLPLNVYVLYGLALHALDVGNIFFSPWVSSVGAYANGWPWKQVRIYQVEGGPWEE